MRTLALDISEARTGWALHIKDEDWKNVKTGSIQAKIEGDEGGTFLAIFTQFQKLLGQMMPDKVIFGEFMHSPNPLAARANLGVRALLMTACYEAGVECSGVSEPRARKSVGVDLTMKAWPEEEEDLKRRTERWNRLGKKTTKPKLKRDMKFRVHKALEDYGINLDSHDEADAVVLLIGAGR